jgi:hypothetical protein
MTRRASELLPLVAAKITKNNVCAGGRYWDRTSDLFGVNADW